MHISATIERTLLVITEDGCAYRQDGEVGQWAKVSVIMIVSFFRCYETLMINHFASSTLMSFCWEEQEEPYSTIYQMITEGL